MDCNPHVHDQLCCSPTCHQFGMVGCGFHCGLFLSKPNHRSLVHQLKDTCYSSTSGEITVKVCKLYPIVNSLGPFLTGLKRGEFRENLCVSGIFCSYQTLPCPKSVEPQNQWKTRWATDFLMFNRILHSWPWKKYVKQYLECIYHLAQHI